MSYGGGAGRGIASRPAALRLDFNRRAGAEDGERLPVSAGGFVRAGRAGEGAAAAAAPGASVGHPLPCSPLKPPGRGGPISRLAGGLPGSGRLASAACVRAPRRASPSPPLLRLWQPAVAGAVRRAVQRGSGGGRQLLALPTEALCVRAAPPEQRGRLCAAGGCTGLSRGRKIFVESFGGGRGCLFPRLHGVSGLVRML